ADTPQLRLARTERDRGVDHAVHRAYGVVADPARHDFPAPDLRVLEKQHVLVHIAERRKRVEQALDDQRAGHAVAYLLIGAAVRVRMVPVQTRRVAGRDADLVALRAAGRDVQARDVAR